MVKKSTNLLSPNWTNLDSYELRLLLDKRIGGGPGQYSDRMRNPKKLHLPLAGAPCQVSLTFKDSRITSIEPGPAFDAKLWDAIKKEIERSILSGPRKVGREFSFSRLLVSGWWSGPLSGVQILPPPRNSPRAGLEAADHPFVLEFPFTSSVFDPVNEHRLSREHRKLTLLLNVLLAGRISLLPHRPQYFWARDPSCPSFQWVREEFLANPGQPVIGALSPPQGGQLGEVDPETYLYEVGQDGLGLRVPADLDNLICLYYQLSSSNQDKFDRATFWMDMAARQWTLSVSASFASLVSAVESLTKRGAVHKTYCETCKGRFQHDYPSATETFRTFFEKYAPGESLRRRRTKMYKLRSDILHGTQLMQLDQDRAFGWDPPGLNERELHNELWALMRIALRNWLRDPPTNAISEEAPTSKLTTDLAWIVGGALIGFVFGGFLSSAGRAGRPGRET
jgi:hypothetical protein